MPPRRRTGTPGKASPKAPPAAKRAAGPKKPAKATRPARPRKPGKATRAELTTRATEVLRRLSAEYPDARCSLDYRTPMELLVATILSAQCTDVRVNLVTPALFAKYPTAAHYAGARPEELEEDIRTTGFFRNKTKSLIGMGSALVEQHGGEVPRTMDELTSLPGVGRKTANVILGNAFGRNEGIVVDTHVGRVSRRLGLAREEDPVKVEEELTRLFPRDAWTLVAHLFIFHGRAVCEARVPKCGRCVLADICPSSLV